MRRSHGWMRLASQVAFFLSTRCMFDGSLRVGHFFSLICSKSDTSMTRFCILANLVWDVSDLNPRRMAQTKTLLSSRIFRSLMPSLVDDRSHLRAESGRSSRVRRLCRTISRGRGQRHGPWLVVAVGLNKRTDHKGLQEIGGPPKLQPELGGPPLSPPKKERVVVCPHRIHSVT